MLYIKNEKLISMLEGEVTCGRCGKKFTTKHRGFPEKFCPKCKKRIEDGMEVQAMKGE